MGLIPQPFVCPAASQGACNSVSTLGWDSEPGYTHCSTTLSAQSCRGRGKSRAGDSWQILEDMTSSEFQFAVDTDQERSEERPNPSHPGWWRGEWPSLHSFLCFKREVSTPTLSYSPAPLSLQGTIPQQLCHSQRRSNSTFTRGRGPYAGNWVGYHFMTPPVVIPRPLEEPFI